MSRYQQTVKQAIGCQIAKCLLPKSYVLLVHLYNVMNEWIGLMTTLVILDLYAQKILKKYLEN